MTAYRFAAVALGPLLALSLAACDAKDETSGEPGSRPAEAPAAAGAGTASGDADLREVSRYQLSMDKVDKYYAALRNIGVAMKAIPEDQRDLSLDASNASLDQYAERLERQPAIKEAIQDAGLSTRDFALLTLAMLQAGMASAVIEARPGDNADSLAREMKTNPDNIKFMREHRAEIEAKQKAMEAEFKRMGATRDR